MLGKSGRLAGALAACLLAWSPGIVLADGGNREHGARDDKRNGHFERHDRRHEYGHRDDHRGARTYAHDDGYCRYSFKSGRHGTRETFRCRDGYRHSPRDWYRYGDAYSHRHRHGGLSIVIRPQRAAPIPNRAPGDQAIVWKDPPNLARYHAAQPNTAPGLDGRYCREYLGTATVGGQAREVYGLACRQPDGAWEIVQ